MQKYFEDAWHKGDVLHLLITSPGFKIGCLLGSFFPGGGGGGGGGGGSGTKCRTSRRLSVVLDIFH